MLDMKLVSAPHNLQMVRKHHGLRDAPGRTTLKNGAGNTLYKLTHPTTSFTPDTEYKAVP